MRVVDRLRSSLQRRAGTVVLRSDVASLGGASQLSDGLRALVSEGALVRLGEGVYAKAARDAEGRPVPASPMPVLIAEVLRKLDVDESMVTAEKEGSHVTLLVDSPRRRINRKLAFGDLTVEIVTRPIPSRAPSVPEDPSRLPRRNVRRFVEQLARWHHVSSASTGIDRWTEAVSRAAGDTVALDAVGRLLAKLKQRHVINGRQMTHLMHNYAMERDGANRHV